MGVRPPHKESSSNSSTALLLDGVCARLSPRTRRDALVGGSERVAAAGEISLERVGIDAAARADLLLHASHGLKHGSVDWATYRRRLEHRIRLASVALDPA